MCVYYHNYICTVYKLIYSALLKEGHSIASLYHCLVQTWPQMIAGAMFIIT